MVFAFPRRRYPYIRKRNYGRRNFDSHCYSVVRGHGGNKSGGGDLYGKRWCADNSELFFMGNLKNIGRDIDIWPGYIIFGLSNIQFFEYSEKDIWF